MKRIFLILLPLLLPLSTFSQKSVEDIKVFNQWSSFDSATGTWGAWKANDEVFILNYKDGNEIARCRLGSKIILLTVNGDEAPKTGMTASGYEYLLYKVTGDFFQPYELRFFTNHPDFGLELETGAVRLRFAKK